MKHDAVAVLVCLLVLCTAPGEGKKKEKELKTITEVKEVETVLMYTCIYTKHCHLHCFQYKPDDCSVFADTGDTMTVHYTVWKADYMRNVVYILYLQSFSILRASCKQLGKYSTRLEWRVESHSL